MEQSRFTHVCVCAGTTGKITLIKKNLKKRGKSERKNNDPRLMDNFCNFTWSLNYSSGSSRISGMIWFNRQTKSIQKTRFLRCSFETLGPLLLKCLQIIIRFLGGLSTWLDKRLPTQGKITLLVRFSPVV